MSASLLGGHMDTLISVELPARRTRRRHEVSFKASIVAACRQPGMSLSAVSLANGLNPNMVRKWMADADAFNGRALCGRQASVAAGLNMSSFSRSELACSSCSSCSDRRL